MRLLTIVATVSCILGWGAGASAQRSGDPPPDDRRAGVVAAASVRPAPGERVSEARFFSTYGERLGLGPEDLMQRVGERKSVISGLTFSRYVQTHQGVRVIGGDYTLTLRDGTVVVGFGRVVPGLTTGTRPVIDAVEAMATAKQDFAARLKTSVGNLEFTTQRSELALASVDDTYGAETYALVHRCVLGTLAPIAEYAIAVDAASGEILRAMDLASADWVPEPIMTTGLSPYNGIVSFNTEKSDADSTHRLRQSKVETFDFTNGNYDLPPLNLPNLVGEPDYLSPTNDFFAAEHLPGVGVHWATERVREFFLAHFGADCLLGKWGFAPLERHRSYVNVEDTNAGWHLEAGIFHYGNLPIHLGSLGVVGHEMAHCVVNRVGTWGNSWGEAGAIEESFGDIMGEMIELSVTDLIDWVFIPPGAPETRSFSAPLTSTPSPQPEYYLGPHWSPTGLNDPDKGGEHRNDSVHNRWFYLIATGSVADQIGVLGELTAMRMAYASVVEKLTSSATYPSAAVATDDVAIDMCGEFSLERVSSHNAWFKLKVLPQQFLAYAYVSPFEEAVAAEPWPAQLRWQAMGITAESAWDVRVSTDPTFQSDVIALDSVGQTESGPNNLPVGVADVFLKPSTKYYWKVRRHTDDPDLNCWRPTNSFTTASKKVKLLSPITNKGNDTKYHPWNLDFTWEPLPGAGSYSYVIEVAKDSSFSSASLLHPSKPEPDTSAQFDVLVSTKVHWHVKPVLHLPGGQKIDGTWSYASFDTTMPKVTITAPVAGDEVFPWPVHLIWKKVVGAGKFILELKLKKGNWGDPSGEFQQIPLGPTKLDYKVNLRGNELNLYYDWRVRVLGPKIGTLEEEGTADESFFKIDWLSTIPTPDTPDLASCPAVSSNIELKWEGVLNATKFIVRAVESVCPLGQPCTQGAPLEPVEVVAQGASVETHHVPSLSSPTSHKNATGYYWKVQAIGPNNLPGWEPGFNFLSQYMLQPPAPTLVSPANGAQFEEGQNVPLSWETAMAHGGGFVVNVWKGEDPCSGPPNNSFLFELGASHGLSVTGPLTNLQTDSDDSVHSWRVKPFVYNWVNSDPCQKPKWSECRTFKVNKPTPPAPTEAPIVPSSFGGNIGLMVAVWTKVNNGTHYQLEAHGLSIDGPLVGTFDWTNAQLQQFKNDLQDACCPLPANNWVAFPSGTTPGNTYFYKVRGCNDGADNCGPWSSWSEWNESYPWPFNNP